MVLSKTAQATVLKGVATSISQLSHPTVEEVNKLLAEFDLEIVSKSETEELLHRAVMMCVIIGQGLGKQEGTVFGDRANEIIHFAKHNASAYNAISAMNDSYLSEQPVNTDKTFLEMKKILKL